MATKANGVIFIKNGDFTATYLTLLNRYTNQILQHEDLDENELSNRLKQLNIIDDGVNKDDCDVTAGAGGCIV